MSSPPPGGCPRCHLSGLPADSRFCTRCGAPLDAVPSAGTNGLPPLPMSARTDLPPLPPAAVAPSPAGSPARAGCAVCGGQGAGVPEDQDVCAECHWLRPLAPGYHIDCAQFQWAQDGAAMARLRSLAPVNKSAQAISDRIGRRWVESTFSAVRLGPRQLSGVWRQAVLAARILALPSMPDVYVSGDKLWDSITYGSEHNAFIIFGSALVNNFRGEDLLFLMAREMGHCRAGHALWKTVLRFLVGEQGPRRGFAGSGLLSALNPFKLVGSALELPLMAWARQADITGDRAGLLAVGDLEVARRVLLSWSLKSTALARMVDARAWQAQLDDGDDDARLGEFVQSSTPYITRRLKLLDVFAESPQMAYWRPLIHRLKADQRQPERVTRPVVLRPPPLAPAPGSAGQDGPPPPSDDIRVRCPACQASMRIPRSVLAGRDSLRVRCPKPGCGRVTLLGRAGGRRPDAVGATSGEE